MYISHMRSEGNRLLEAIDEVLAIARAAHIRAEIYHLKAAGKSNWTKLGDAIAKVDAARKEGLEITADMYTYTAGSTGLDAAMPPWVQEGGYKAWAARLHDSKVRGRLRFEMTGASDDWENLLAAAGGDARCSSASERGTAVECRQDARGSRPAARALGPGHGDGPRRRGWQPRAGRLLPDVRGQRAPADRAAWVSFGSDASSMATEGVFLKTSTHPRAYGNFAALLGKYVRDEQVISLEEAVRKLTSLPAATLRITERGRLAPGYFADIVVFDAKTIADRSTYEQPHQYADRRAARVGERRPGAERTASTPAPDPDASCAARAGEQEFGIKIWNLEFVWQFQILIS